MKCLVLCSNPPSFLCDEEELGPFGFILTQPSIRLINGEVDNYKPQVSKRTWKPE
jgi:hypothetical protein